MAETYSLSIIFKAIDQATKPIRDIARSFNPLTRTVDAVTKSLRQLSRDSSWENIQRQAKFIGRAFSKDLRAFSNSLSRAGDGMARFGRNMTMKMSVPIAAFGGLAFKASKDFNEGMARIGTLIPGQTARLNQLKIAAMEMAVETGKLPVTIADGIYQMISALGDSVDTMGKLKVAALASVAGIAPLSEAVELLAGSARAYSDNTLKFFQRTANVMFGTVKRGMTTFPELAESMKLVIPLAAKLNVPIEEISAAVGTLAGVSGNTSMVVTQMAAVLTAFLRGGGKESQMGKAIAFINTQLGTTYKSSIDFIKDKGIKKSLEILGQITGGREEQLTKILGGRKEALMGALTLIGSQLEKFTENIDLNKISTEELNSAVLEMVKGINRTGFRWDQFSKRITNLRIHIGDQLNPVIQRFMTLLGPFDKSFESLDSSIKKSIIGIGLFLVAIWPLTWVLGGIIGSLGKLGLVLSKLGVVFTFAISHPIIALIGLLISVGLMAHKVWVNWDEYGPKFKDFFEKLGGGWDIFKDKADKALIWIGEKLKEFVKDIPQMVRDAFANIDWTQEIKTTSWSMFKFLPEQIFNLFSPIGNKIAESLYIPKETDEMKKRLDEWEKYREVAFGHKPGFEFLTPAMNRNLQHWAFLKEDQLNNYIKYNRHIEEATKKYEKSIKDSVSRLQGVFDLPIFSIPSLTDLVTPAPYLKPFMTSESNAILNITKKRGYEESSRRLNNIFEKLDNSIWSSFKENTLSKMVMPTTSLGPSWKFKELQYREMENKYKGNIPDYILEKLQAETDITLHIKTDPGVSSTVTKVINKKGKPNIKIDSSINPINRGYF